jgi:hypothetical protein
MVPVPDETSLGSKSSWTYVTSYFPSLSSRAGLDVLWEVPLLTCGRLPEEGRFRVVREF